MANDQKYWLTQSRFTYFLFVGCIGMFLLVQNDKDTAGYVVGALGVVLSAFILVFVDMKNARSRRGRG